MSLTKQNLAAIGKLFDERFNANFDAKFDEKMEPYMQQIAAGFTEVHERLNTIEYDLHEVKDDLKETKDIVGRIELQQRAVVREDEHAIRIERLEQHTGLAPYSLPKSRLAWHNKRKQ
ncbi:MAG TPA: hypothetical protein VGO07_07410 [Candidatus Saccharimonadales bacterium]|jgi:hypothetical protein|nr:hypothetical protein [Candidatus Saccharimonadales bacterium]